MVPNGASWIISAKNVLIFSGKIKFFCLRYNLLIYWMILNFWLYNELVGKLSKWIEDYKKKTRILMSKNCCNLFFSRIIRSLGLASARATLLCWLCAGLSSTSLSSSQRTQRETAITWTKPSSSTTRLWTFLSKTIILTFFLVTEWEWWNQYIFLPLPF